MIQECTYSTFTLKLKYTVVDLSINNDTFVRTVTFSITVVSDNVKSIIRFTHVISMLLHRLHFPVLLLSCYLMCILVHQHPSVYDKSINIL